MSTTTTNLGLVKPELTDVADITAMNANWDKIDNLMVAKTGDTMTGSLKIKGDWNILNLTNSAGSREAYMQLTPTGGLQLTERAYNDQNNAVTINLLGHGSNEDLQNWLKLSVVKNGTWNSYNIFGEHNIELLRQYISTDVPATLV